jgi:hypothetical protein
MRIYIFFFKLAGVRPASISFVPRALALSLSKAALFVVNEEWGSREEDERRDGRRAHAHPASIKKDVAGRRPNGAHIRTLRRKRRTGRCGLRKNGARCAGKEGWGGAAKERRARAHAAPEKNDGSGRRKNGARTRTLRREGGGGGGCATAAAASAAAEISSKQQQQQQQRKSESSSSSRKQQQ